ncbi:MAG: acetyltransferase [Acidimicrobiales bacterium]
MRLRSLQLEVQPRDLVLVGAGGFGRESIEVVRAINNQQRTWNLLGFLDDATTLQGRRVSGVSVLGSIGDAAHLQTASVTLCTGSPANYSSRQHIAQRLGLSPDRYATLVHPSAAVPLSVQLGVGCVLQAGVVATADIVLGNHVLVMPGVVFTHDNVIGDFVTIGAGASFAGGVRVEPGAYIGAGVLVGAGCTIGAGSLLGLGAVVLRDVPPGQVWCGNPARYLRDASCPPHSSAVNAQGIAS